MPPVNNATKAFIFILRGGGFFGKLIVFIRETFGVLIYFKKNYLLGGPMLHRPCIGIEIFKKTYNLSILVALLKKLKNH